MSLAGSIGEWMSQAAAELQKAEIENPRSEARQLLCLHLKLTAGQVIAYPEKQITELAELNQLLARRCSREPLSHIIGVREFWSMEFIVNRHVLDPRADSETLIEALLARVEHKEAPLQIIDFGTGSGCLMLAMLSELPNARALGVDISEEALAVAQQNARKLGFADRCEFVQSNWGEEVSISADIILSNPPYIPSVDIAGLQSEVKNFEPRLALDGGADGLNPYPILTKTAHKLLNKKGILGFEFGIYQENDVLEILKNAGFGDIFPHKDLGNIIRCLTAVK